MPEIPSLKVLVRCNNQQREALFTAFSTGTAVIVNGLFYQITSLAFADGDSDASLIIQPDDAYCGNSALRLPDVTFAS